MEYQFNIRDYVATKMAAKPNAAGAGRIVQALKYKKQANKVITTLSFVTLTLPGSMLIRGTSTLFRFIFLYSLKLTLARRTSCLSALKLSLSLLFGMLY